MVSVVVGTIMGAAGKGRGLLTPPAAPLKGDLSSGDADADMAAGGIGEVGALL